MNSIHRVGLATLLLAAGLGSGCERPSAESASNPPAANVAWPADLFTPEPPAGGRSVAEVKADAGATGEVVVHGRIGGRREPFTAGAALFVLADARLKACNENPDDGCKTPWDYCCEPREHLAAHTITIQVPDPAGQPLRAGLQGVGGLQPLAEVTVVGRVAQRGAEGVLIDAHRIHVGK